MPTRKGQSPPALLRDAFRARFMERYSDPAFLAVKDALDSVEEIAWNNYADHRKAPRTQKAGSEFADPGYDLSVEWKATRDRLLAAEQRQRNAAAPSRVLLICGAARNDGSCPGEMSKTYRMTRMAAEVLAAEGVEADILDLSLLTSDYGRRIHPCKGCVSTAMPLCHWPCSCYPNHSQQQVGDWMAEIYERWTLAHGVIILTPVYWYQAPSVLKLMIDRMVCADGGNPDPTTTSGKNAEQAKAIERAGWSYPKHLAGRIYGLVVHGDVAGTEALRRNLADWLGWMGLIDAGATAQLDRLIGYYESYADSHEAFDRDIAVQQEIANVAKAVANAVALRRQGRYPAPDAGLPRPRPK